MSTSSLALKVTTPTANAIASLSNFGSFHIISVRGQALEIRVDGAPTKGTLSTSDVSFPATLAWLNEPNAAAGIDYAELIGVKGALTDPQIAGVEAYLKNKYSL